MRDKKECLTFIIHEKEKDLRVQRAEQNRREKLQRVISRSDVVETEGS